MPRLKTKPTNTFFCVILFYLLVTVFMTYPIIFNMNTAIAGTGGDSRWTLWSFWWANKAFDEGKSLFFSDFLYYPAGKNIALHLDGILNIFLSVILHKLGLSLIFIYNF